MSLKFFLNSDDFGIFPVPIAHLGSYAKIILLIFFIFFNAMVICLLSTERVLLFFFSLYVSPIQRITFNFSLSAEWIFLFISISFSWFLISEWPTITYSPPADLINLEFTDPVNAP